MAVSEEFIVWLISYEGEELEGYIDPVGIPTIGVGHTGRVNGRRVFEGMRITKEMSRRLLREDLQQHETFVKKLVPWRWRWRRRQREVFISLSFNLGPEILTADPPYVSVGKVLRRRQITRRTIAELGEAIKLFNKGGDPPRVLPGLVKRREAEVHLFKTGQYRHNK